MINLWQPQTCADTRWIRKELLMNQQALVTTQQNNTPFPPQEDLSALPERFVSLLYTHYRFHLQFSEKAFLPVFKGTLLRGAWMWELKRQECHHPHFRSCTDCPLLAECHYPMLFEAANEPTVQHLLERHNNTLPVVIKPPQEYHQHFDKDTSLHFEVILMAPYHRRLPAMLRALIELGQRGFSADKGSGQSRFDVTAVESMTPHGWQKVSQPPHITQIEPPHIWSVGQWPMFPIPAHTVQLSITTPVRLRFEQSYVTPEALTLEHMIRSICRRLTELYQNFSNQSYETRKQAPFPDLYESIVELSRSLKISLHKNNLRRVALTRNSNRRNHATQLDGLMGSLTLHNVPPALLWLLQMGQIFHMGKSSAHGSGQYQLQVQWME